MTINFLITIIIMNYLNCKQEKADIKIRFCLKKPLNCSVAVVFKISKMKHII